MLLWKISPLLPVSWCYIDPEFSLLQGGCWASCLWFTQECLGYWIKHAKFCKEKVGFGSLMTAAVDIFCWGEDLSSFVFAFVGLWQSCVLWGGGASGKESSGRISFNTRVPPPLYNPNLLWFFWVTSSSYLLSCVDPDPPNHLLELGQLPPKCSRVGGNLLYHSLYKEILQIFILTTLFLSVVFLNVCHWSTLPFLIVLLSPL